MEAQISYQKNWSYIKDRAYTAACRLIDNHNDVEDNFWKGLLNTVSKGMAKHKFEKATDQQVLDKYLSDYKILKEFFDEIEEWKGLRQVSNDFPLYKPFGKVKNLFGDL